MVITCLFAATKCEETVKKLLELIPYAFSVLKPSVPITEEMVNDLRKRILLYEQELLEACSFVFHMVHPHEGMLRMIKRLGLDKDFAWKCWQILLASYEAPLCIQFPPNLIGLAIIYLVAKRHSRSNLIIWKVMFGMSHLVSWRSKLMMFWFRFLKY
jgi:hypothetical protein